MRVDNKVMDHLRKIKLKGMGARKFSKSIFTEMKNTDRDEGLTPISEAGELNSPE